MAKKKKKEEKFDLKKAFETATYTEFEDRKKYFGEKVKETEQQKRLFDSGSGSLGTKIKNTAADVSLNILKGGIGATEGVSDFMRRRGASVLDRLGWDDKAEQLRNTANQNTTEGIASDFEHILYGDLSGSKKDEDIDVYEKMHEKSALTDRSRGIAQSVGYSVTNAAMSTAMGGGNIGSLLLTGVSAGGSAESRAIEQGMDEDDAFIYGVLSGSGEAVSEAFFGGVGKFTKALGYGKGALDDVLIENVTKRIGSNVLRSLTSFGLRAGGEGFEEILSAAFDTAAQKISGMDERSLAEIWQDQKVGQSFVDGVISSMFSSSPRLVSSIATGANYDNGTTRNEQKVIEDIIDQRTQGRELSNKERGDLRQQITKDLIDGKIAGSEIDKALQNTETTWNQKKDKYITRTVINENTKFTTTDDDLKIDKKQLNKNANLEDVQNKIKVLEQDFLNANNDVRNTTSSHELFDEMKRMIVATGEQQRLTSNKQMAEDGALKLLTNKKGEPIRNGRGELQYVKADTGQLVTINGYHTKEGMVLNSDSHQIFESTMGHELGESLKANTPEIYKQLRDLAVEVGRADGTLTKETFDAIKSTYGELGTNTDNYLDEYVNDKIGEMFKSDSTMFQEIGKKPNIARRLLNEIKYLIQKFTAGSPEQKRLLEAQHNLKKALHESVRNLNINQEQKTENIQQQTTEEIAPIKEQVKEKPKKFTEVTDEDLFNINMEEVENQFDKQEYKLNEDIETEDNPIGNAWDLDDYYFKLKDGNTLWINTPYEYGKNKDGSTNYNDTSFKRIDFTIEDSNGEIIDEYSIKNEKGEFTRDEILNAIKHMTYDDSNKVADGQLDIFDNVHRNDGHRYSLSQDNQGRQLSEQQQEYFKESKATDENGNLITVYHTTTDEIAQFNEFNPVGTPYYRFGDTVVNYYTDSKEMSGSYASQDYKMADTKKLESIEDAQKYLNHISKLNGNEYNISKHNTMWGVTQDKQISKEARQFIDSLTDNEKQQMLDNIYEDELMVQENPNYARVFSWNYFDKDLQKKYHALTEKYLGTADTVAIQQEVMKYLESPVLLSEDNRLKGETVGIYESEDELLRNLKSDLQKQDWSKNNKIQYEGYVNITNPYIIDAEQRNWNQVVQQSNDFIDDLVDRVPQEIKDNLTRLYQESENISTDSRDGFNAIDNAISSINEPYLSSNLDEDTRIANKIVRRAGFDNVEKFLNGENPNIDFWYTLASELEEADMIDRPTSVKIVDDYVVPDNIRQWLNDNYTKEIKSSDFSTDRAVKMLGEKTSLKDLYNKRSDLYENYDKYRYEDSYFLEKISSDTSEEGYVDMGYELNDIFETRAEIMGTDTVAKEIGEAAKNGFSKPQLIRLWGTSKTTNDIVQEIIKSNSDGNTNYDGVIIKNVYDYGGKAEGEKQANNLYITFASNQFKAADNVNPTSDNDIRYSLSEAPKQNNEGTELTPEQQEYFKDAKTIDKDGNLKVYYNGSPSVFYEYDASKMSDGSKWGKGIYLSEYSDVSAMYGDNVRKVYANITNPISDRLKTITFEQYNDLYQRLYDGEQAYQEEYDMYNNDLDLLWDVTNKGRWADYAQEIKEATGKDGIIIDRMEKSEDMAIAFQSNQIKYTDNLNPTDNPDIRRSLSNQNDIAPFGEGIKSEQIKPRDIQQTIQNSVQEAIAPIREQVQQIADEVIKSENLDDIELNLEPFMDMINGDNGQVLSNINKNYDQIMTNLQEQGLPKDAAQSFLQNMVHKYDQAFNRVKQRMTEKQANKVQKMILDAQEKFTNRNAVIDKLAKDSGNEMIKYKGDLANNSFGQAQYNVQTAQTDLNGNEIGKSVNQLFEPAEKQGLGAVLDDYLFHKSNIERHAVGKGSLVPAAISEQLIADYEKSYPQLKIWAEDFEKYYDNLLNLEVESGLTDQDTFNLLRGEKGIYRSYIPFFENETEKRYYDDAGDLKPIKPLKRAKGGANQSKLMGMKQAMIKQTMAVWNSMRTNQLYQEIINTLGGEEGLGFIVRNDPSNLSQSLYTDQDGNKFLTAYVNGQEMSTKISDELYNELSKKSENAIKEFEDKYSLLIKPLQGISNFRRNILTSYNPTFAMFKNPIKDIQDATLYSKHTAEMLKELPGAYADLMFNKSKEAKQFRALYGTAEYKGFGKHYGMVTEVIELAPRLAEFKASLKAGESVEQALYNARDITTNFGRGGYITKALNRNGATFLNASVQGFSKFYRNFAEQPNAGKFAMAVGKAAMLGVVPAIFNELAFGGGDDKDEDYAALPDYIKDNYYLFKTGDGEFIRIPKGRALSVMGSAARRTLEKIEGEEDAFDGYLKNAWSQIGPVEIGGNPLDNTIIAPIAQVMGGKKRENAQNTPGRAWYGGDIVPYRLQTENPEDQYDASVDKMSIWLGDKLGISPYKINYVIDQYTGGLGDLVLPMLTEETKSGAESPLEYAIAPVKDQVVVNSIDDNKYASEFYSAKGKINTGSKATDKDKLKYQYMNDVSFDLSALYKEKRAVQADSSLDKKEKYEKVQQVQKQINEIAKNGLELSDKISVQGNYADVGEDRGYYKNTKGKWTAISQDDMVTIESLGLSDSEKSAYFDVKNQIYNLDNNYRAKKEGKSESEQIQLGIQQKKDRIETIKSSTLPDSAKYAAFDTKYDDKLLPYYEDLGFKANDVLDYKQQTFTADKDKNGKSITNSRKKKVVNYINDMNIPYEQKLILYKKEYKSDKSYDNAIFNYINNSNLDYTSKTKILDELGIKYR